LPSSNGFSPSLVSNHSGRNPKYFKRDKETRPFMANTKAITDTLERKKIKRAARKAAPAKGPRAGARGESKQKLKKASRGKSKR
jgi:hypothetical protein